MLPSPADLERTCRGLATLDALMSEDWESRYYSFNANWSAGLRMASMRNGSGDDWFIVFSDAGVFVKSFWHEHKPEDVVKMYAGLPAPLKPNLKDFQIEDGVTFGGFHDGESWTLRGNAKPMKEELEILTGDPATYRAYAREYFEAKVPLDAIAHVLAGKKLTAALVARISTERTLAELADDLSEIGYGT